MRVFDLFAGAGGFGLGFRMANFKIDFSLEKDAWAAETLKANSENGSTILCEDIRNFSNQDLILEAVDGKRPSVVIGGPPCQGFSVAGPSKDPADPRNSLFKDFAKWVEILSPNVFIMENVTGLLNRRNIDGELVLDIIKNTFSEIGYTVDIWILNAALYGVPQLRHRVFIVGNKYGCSINPPPPTHYTNIEPELQLPFLKPAITIHESIGDLPYIESGQGQERSPYVLPAFHDYQQWARLDSEEVYNHVAMIHTKRVIERYRHIQSGTLMDDLPTDSKVRKRGGKGAISETAYHSNYRHLKNSMVSYTIPASFYSTFIHPTAPRNITSREAARIQSFPDHYLFKGKRTVISSKLLEKKGRLDENYLSQYNQIGNAVPPLLSYNIAKHIKSFLRFEEQKKLSEVDLAITI